MKYRIELTDNQMRVLQKCTEMYFRLLLGQTREVADEISSIGVDFSKDNPDHDAIFSRYIQKRNDVEEIMRVAVSIGLPQLYQKTDDMEIAECIWDAIRYVRGQSRLDGPYHIGPEPSPKIEEIKD